MLRVVKSTIYLFPQLILQKAKCLFTIIVCVLAGITEGNAQDSTLLSMLEDSMQLHSPKESVKATFKATHVINLQSIETPARGVLQLLIMHRFGKINDGGYELFGLDNASMRMGFDYGLTDRLALGVGRSSFDKTYDASIKYKLLQQTEASRKVPVSITAYTTLAYTTLKYTDKSFLNAKLRTSYATQLLIARKFNRNLSLQIAPTWLHYNLVPTGQDKNDVFAVGVGGRMKLSKRVSLNAEYNYLPSNALKSTDVYNSFSVGFDIETGGHVFQLHLTNSSGMIEPAFMGRTTGRWGKGDIFFGFNMSRAFNLKRSL